MVREDTSRRCLLVRLARTNRWWFLLHYKSKHLWPCQRNPLRRLKRYILPKKPVMVLKVINTGRDLDNAVGIWSKVNIAKQIKNRGFLPKVSDRGAKIKGPTPSMTTKPSHTTLVSITKTSRLTDQSGSRWHCSWRHPGHPQSSRYQVQTLNWLEGWELLSVNNCLAMPCTTYQPCHQS